MKQIHLGLIPSQWLATRKGENTYSALFTKGTGNICHILLKVETQMWPHPQMKGWPQVYLITPPVPSI